MCKTVEVSLYTGNSLRFIQRSVPLKRRAPWYPTSLRQSYQCHNKVLCHTDALRHVQFMATTDEVHTVANNTSLPAQNVAFSVHSNRVLQI